MNDIFHEWGGDFSVSSTGDLAVAAGTTAINQRVCRRLLTNPGDYIWNLDYGGGLAQFVGFAVNVAKIEAAVGTQLALEAAVPASPAPQVSTQVVDGANGYVISTITYSDPVSSEPAVINVSSSQPG